MKKTIIMLLMSAAPLTTNSTVIWGGIMAPGTAHAINDNVQINADTWLPNETVVIHADSRDITVYLLNGPHHVYSNNNGQTTLQLIAEYPYTIEIIIDKNLTFGGVANNLTLPLNIEERTGVTGQGLIKWTVADNCKLCFGDPDDVNRGGVLLQLVCNDSLLLPKHIFKANEKSDDKSQIRFTGDSGLFLVQETVINPTSLLQPSDIDASNTDNQQTRVNFKDGSGFFFQFVGE